MFGRTGAVHANTCKNEYFQEQILQGACKEQILQRKRAGRWPCSRNVSTLNFPEKLDFILIDGATLLLRARAPPETWTTRLEPFGRLETAVVDHFYWLVIIFSTSCPKYEQPA
jgi:hypothetical protein